MPSKRWRASGRLTIPVRYIGVGEQIDDLRPFEHEDFVAALFDGVEGEA